MGKICVLDIDIQGVKQIKGTLLEPLYVFVKPPSLMELEQRLKARKTETEESLKRRLAVAKIELEYGMFYLICNCRKMMLKNIYHTIYVLKILHMIYCYL